MPRDRPERKLWVQKGLSEMRICRASSAFEGPAPALVAGDVDRLLPSLLHPGRRARTGSQSQALLVSRDRILITNH